MQNEPSEIEVLTIHLVKAHDALTQLAATPYGLSCANRNDCLCHQCIAKRALAFLNR